MKYCLFLLFLLGSFNLFCKPDFVNEVTYTFIDSSFINNTGTDIKNQFLFIGDGFSIGKRIERIDNNSFLLVSESQLPSINTENYNFFSDFQIKKAYKIGYFSEVAKYMSHFDYLALQNDSIILNTFIQYVGLPTYNYSSFRFDKEFNLGNVYYDSTQENVILYKPFSFRLPNEEKLVFNVRDRIIDSNWATISYLKYYDSFNVPKNTLALDTVYMEDKYVFFSHNLNLKNYFFIFGSNTDKSLIKLKFINKDNYKPTYDSVIQLKFNFMVSEVIESNDSVKIFLKKYIGGTKVYEDSFIVLSFSPYDPDKFKTDTLNFDDAISFNKIKKISENQFIAVGSVYLPDSNNTDFKVVCFDKHFNILWQRTWGGAKTTDKLNDFYRQNDQLFLTGTSLISGTYHSYFATLDLPLTSIEEEPIAITNLNQSTHIELFDILGRSIAKFPSYEKLKAEIENYPPPHLLKWRDEKGIFHFEKLK